MTSLVSDVPNDLAEDEELDENESETTHGHDAEIGKELPATAIAPPTVARIVPTAITGIIAGIAASIEVTGTKLLAITKLKTGEVLITIQDAPKEDAPAVLPIQVKGMPEEVDARLLDALSHYVPACEYSVASAVSVSQSIAAAAEKDKAKRLARNTSTTARAATPAKVVAKTQTLTVNVKSAGGLETLEQAILSVADMKGTPFPVTAGIETALPLGSYMITIAAIDFENLTKSATLAGSPVTLDVALEPAKPKLF